MFRYFALRWDESNIEAALTARRLARKLQESSHDWSSSLEIPGLAVLVADIRPAPNTVYALANGSGVVLGKLFRAHNESMPSVPITLNENDAADIVRSCGRRLIEQYWGRYIAFIRDAHSATTWVLRDPTGGLPCFMTHYKGVDLYFSCVEDCSGFDELSFSLNWRYVAARVCYPGQLQTSATGLSEVSEVQPGECWQQRSGDSVTKQLYWNPALIARSDPIENFDAATTLLRQTTHSCINAWASCYPNILHLLSGGLDSSIVLSCLKAAPTKPRVTCLNFFDSSSRVGDERELARLAASSTGVDLIESEQQGKTVDLTVVLNLRKNTSPQPLQYDMIYGGIETQIAREKEAPAIFYGVGGDQVFYQSPLEHAASDCFLRYGFGKRLFGIAMDIATAKRMSLWSVLRTAIKSGWLSRLHGGAAFPKLRELRVVLPETIRSAQGDDYLLHTWLRETRHLPPGKLEHIRMMSTPRELYSPLASADAPERIRPLLSQPLMELCLRIPTYVLTKGGRDRAVARYAFAKEIPPKIFSRHAKGINDQVLHRTLQANAKFIREFLLDGQLVKERLLDRSKIEQALAGERPSLGPEVGEILVYHLSTEAWLNRWTH